MGLLLLLGTQSPDDSITGLGDIADLIVDNVALSDADIAWLAESGNFLI